MNEKEKYIEEVTSFPCIECGRIFRSWLALAGHILRSPGHDEKKWAYEYLKNHNKLKERRLEGLETYGDYWHSPTSKRKGLEPW